MQKSNITYNSGIDRLRFYWVDNIKSFGIIFVVLGHTISISNTILAQYLYSFHIPLFFFISGFLISNKTLKLDWSKFFKKFTKDLLIPYILYGTITYIIWIFYIAAKNYILGDTNVDFISPIYGLIYGVNGKENLITHNGPLWFFTALFMLHILHYVINKYVNSKYKLIFISIAMYILGYTLFEFLEYRLPWNIEIAMIGLIFYTLGRILKNMDINYNNISRVKLFILSILLFISHILLFKINGFVDLNNGQINNPIYYFIIAFFGIFSWVSFSMILPKIIIFEKISTSTLSIFSVHITMFLLFSIVFVYFLNIPVQSIQNSFTFSLIYTVLAISLIAFFYNLVGRRY